MDAHTAATFEVSDVVRAVDPLPEVPYKQAVEALLTKKVRERDPWLDEYLVNKGRLIDRPETPAPRPVEACTRYHGRLLAGVQYHSVVAAVHTALHDPGYPPALAWSSRHDAEVVGRGGVSPIVEGGG